jgi:demethoxyubiquinone hydroxylase (CLK1/Coq7/Cat5 family)
MGRDERLTVLRLLLNREVMAVQAYRRQIWRFRRRKEISERLQRAAENEREHVVYLRERLAALSGAPSWLRFPFYIFGALALGFGPALLGKRFTMKSDVWIERMAVKHYTQFLNEIAFDDESKALIEKIVRDEERHIETWQDCLSMLRSTTAATGGGVK